MVHDERMIVFTAIVHGHKDVQTLLRSCKSMQNAEPMLWSARSGEVIHLELGRGSWGEGCHKN